MKPISLYGEEGINNVNSCSICLESLNENDKHIIEECKHEFHNVCLISWLRSGNTSCPICRNNNGYKYFNINDNKFICESIIQYSKTHKMHRTITNLVKKYEKIIVETKNNNKILKQIVKKNKNINKELNQKRSNLRKEYTKNRRLLLKEYNENLKKINDESKIINKDEILIQRTIFKHSNMLRDIERKMSLVPIVPLKIT